MGDCWQFFWNFQRGRGSSLKWKIQRGGGSYMKFPPWWGYGSFLELHNIILTLSHEWGMVGHVQRFSGVWVGLELTKPLVLKELYTKYWSTSTNKWNTERSLFQVHTGELTVIESLWKMTFKVFCQRKDLIKASLKMPALQNHHGDQFTASDIYK